MSVIKISFPSVFIYTCTNAPSRVQRANLEEKKKRRRRREEKIQHQIIKKNHKIFFLFLLVLFYIWCLSVVVVEEEEEEVERRRRTQKSYPTVQCARAHRFNATGADEGFLYYGKRAKTGKKIIKNKKPKMFSFAVQRG